MDEQLLAHLKRIEEKLDALAVEVHQGLKPDVSELKRKASLWGAVGGSLPALATLFTQLMGHR